MKRSPKTAKISENQSNQPNLRSILPNQRSFSKHGLILLFFTVVTCLLLYPLPFHLSNGLVAAESGDPLLQIWVVQWNIHKLTTSLSNYFDANIFYPYSNTFAFHDHLFLEGVLGLPIFLISKNPILTYNVLFLLSFVLSAYCMYLFCREITQNDYAAVLAGLIFGFLPFRFAHLDHLNLLHIQWFPVCLLFLTRLLIPQSGIRRSSLKKDVGTIALFWFFFLLQVLSSFNYLFMLTYAIGIFGVAMVVVQWRNLPDIPLFRSQGRILAFVAAACLVGMLLLPFALPYFQAHQEMGFQRSLAEAESLSARLQDYLVAPDNNILYGKVTRPLQSTTSPFPREQMLFPGIVPVLLAVWGIFKKKKPSRSSKSVKVSVLVLLTIAGVLSFGPSMTILGKRLPLPYLWLYNYVPGFNSMRVPARFGLLVFFAMAVLAAMGITQLLESYNKGRRKTKLASVLLTCAAGSLILFEDASFPQQLSFYPATQDTIPPVYRWLGEQPEDVSLIELPLDSAKANFEYAYYSTFHWKRLVNGRSAFIPGGIAQIFAEMRHFPSQRSCDLLKNLGVDMIILHKDFGTRAFGARASCPHRQRGQDVRAPKYFGNDMVLSFAEKPPEGWQNSGNFRTSVLDLNVHVPSVVRSGETHTAGVTLQALPPPFCPLPYESAEIAVEWRTARTLARKETQTIPLPLLFQQNIPFTLPVSLHAPDMSGDYQVLLHTEHPLFRSRTVSATVTISPDIPDSRRPDILAAQFLEVDIPSEWQAGKPLPVRVLVKNSGNTLWKARTADSGQSAGDVRLGVIDWKNVKTGHSLLESHPQLFQARGVLPYDAAPGDTIVLSMTIHTPDAPGTYELQLHLVSELIQWFSTEQSEPLTTRIVLK